MDPLLNDRDDDAMANADLHRCFVYSAMASEVTKSVNSVT